MSRVVGIDVRFIATVGVRGFGENSCIIFRVRFLPSFRRFLSNILTLLLQVRIHVAGCKHFGEA